MSPSPGQTPAAGQRSSPFDLSVRLQSVPALCPNTMQPRPAELHKQIPLWVFPQMQGGGHPWTGSGTSVQIQKAVPPSNRAADWAFLNLTSREKPALKTWNVQNSTCPHFVFLHPGRNWDFNDFTYTIGLTYDFLVKKYLCWGTYGKKLTCISIHPSGRFAHCKFFAQFS